MIGHRLDDKVSVSPQISPVDLVQLAAEGVTSIICNRPDAEVGPDLASSLLEAAATDAGLGFCTVPLAPGALTLETIANHLEAIDAAKGQVLAYCASGTRSAFLWAFAMAFSDRMVNEDILAALDRAGYPSPGLIPQLDQVRALGR